MTGNEYYKLSHYDEDCSNNEWSVVIATHGSCQDPQEREAFYIEGEIFYVEYRSRFEELIYLRAKEDSRKVIALTPKSLIRDFELYKEDTKHMKTINIPFDKNDKVWFMNNNKVRQGTVKNYTIKSVAHMDYIDISYEVMYKDNLNYQTCFKSKNELYNTKEELIKSL